MTLAVGSGVARPYVRTARASGIFFHFLMREAPESERILWILG